MILSKFTRQQIYGAKGKPVEIMWPKDAEEPIVGNKYTIQSSAEKAGDYKFIVEAVAEVADGFKATIRLDADPTRLLGKSGGYSTAAQGAISTRKGREADAMGGPQFRSEVEPEAVDEETQRQITAKGRHNRAEFQRELAEEDAELAEELARKRERAVRDRLRLVCKGLTTDGALALLGSIERKLQEAETGRAA